MSQHPNHNPSSLQGEIAVVLGEMLATIGDQMHVVARLAMLSRDLAEGTSLPSGDAALRQEIAGIAQRLSTSAPAAPPIGRPERRDMVLDLYATTDLALAAIARRAGVDTDTPRRILRKARAAGDRRVAQGDLRRQPAADQAAPSPASPSAPHDGLPEDGGKASPERPVESGVMGTNPAKGEEVVPAPDRGEELTTSDDPRPAPEPEFSKPIGIITSVQETASGIIATAKATPPGRSAIDALRAANLRLMSERTEMELADELDEEPQPRRAEPEARRSPAGLAQRVADRVERPQEPLKPVTKAIPLTEAEIGLPIIHVDKKGKKVVGPVGVWGGCPDIVLNVMARLSDGNLYGQPVLQKLAGFARPETFDTILKRWREELRAIGVEMFVGQAGVRLQRQEIL